MQFLIRPLIWAIASLSFLSVATPSLADATVPIDKALAQIQGKTQVPILIPSVMPNVSRIYVSGTGRIDGYSLNLSLDPNCRGTTACNYAWMSAERGRELLLNSDRPPMNPRDTITSVKLAKEIQGQFSNICGAYCIAQVAWQSQGVLYRAVVKNGRKATVIALANSAILGGVRRNAAASRPVAQNDLAHTCQQITQAWLRSEERGTPINVRDGASTQAYARHIGYAGNNVAVVNRTRGDNGYCWYKVRFESKATGWVRGDHVSPSLGE